MSRAAASLTGKRFGVLTVLQPVGRGGANHKLWQCRCDCGVVCVKIGHHLRSGHAKWCGRLCAMRPVMQAIQLRTQGVPYRDIALRFGYVDDMGFPHVEPLRAAVYERRCYLKRHAPQQREVAS